MRCQDERSLETLIEEVLELYDAGNFTLKNVTSSDNKLQWDIPNSMFFAATIATTIGREIKSCSRSDNNVNKLTFDR